MSVANNVKPHALNVKMTHFEVANHILTQIILSITKLYQLAVSKTLLWIFSLTGRDLGKGDSIGVCQSSMGHIKSLLNNQTRGMIETI